METTKKEAVQAAVKWSIEADKRYGYANPILSYLEGIADFKASLIEEIEKKIKVLRNAKYKFRNMSAEDAYVISHLEEVLELPLNQRSNENR